MKRISFLVVAVILAGIAVSIGILNNETSFQSAAVLYNTIIIDPGHGGKDTGAVYGSLCEDEINYDIAIRLYNRLKQKRKSVFITVKDDSFPQPSGKLFCDSNELLFNNKKITLKERIKLIRMFDQSGKALVVSIHINSLFSIIRGVSFYYPGGTERREKESRAMAHHLKESLMAQNIQPLSIDVGIFTCSFNPVRSRIYRWNFVPAIFSGTGNRTVVLCELGNIRNTKDRKNLTSFRYREFLAYQLYCALISKLR